MFRLGFLCLLSVAVLLKVGSIGSREAPSVDFGQAVARAATDQGFRVVASHGGFLPMVEARTSTCSVSIAGLSPLGYSWDVFHRSALPETDIFVTYNGRRYETQPRWLTTIDFYWARLTRVFGHLVAQRPVLGFAAHRGCRRGGIDELERALSTEYGA